MLASSITCSALTRRFANISRRSKIARMIKPTLEIIRQLRTLWPARELRFEPTDDIPTPMFRDCSKINGVPSKALVIG